jgi:hypothetical protein
MSSFSELTWTRCGEQNHCGQPGDYLVHQHQYTSRDGSSELGDCTVLIQHGRNKPVEIGWAPDVTAAKALAERHATSSWGREQEPVYPGG